MKTHKLLLLVRHQFGDFILASSQLFLVVCELTHNKLLLASVKLEFFDDLLEERHIEESEVRVLNDERRRSWHNHVGQLLKASVPIVEVSLGHDDEQCCQVFRIENEMLLLHKIGQISCEQASTEIENRVVSLSHNHLSFWCTLSHVCFFSRFCKLPFKLLYALDLVLRSASICPTCFEMISAILRSDCLTGYFAMSHWNRVMYCDKSAKRE